MRKPGHHVPQGADHVGRHVHDGNTVSGGDDEVKTLVTIFICSTPHNTSRYCVFFQTRLEEK
jgi:hypothetical protein